MSYSLKTTDHHRHLWFFHMEGMYLYTVELQFPFIGTMGPKPVSGWWCPCAQHELHEEIMCQVWSGRTQVFCIENQSHSKSTPLWWTELNGQIPTPTPQNLVETLLKCSLLLQLKESKSGMWYLKSTYRCDCQVSGLCIVHLRGTLTSSVCLLVSGAVKDSHFW